MDEKCLIERLQFFNAAVLVEIKKYEHEMKKNYDFFVSVINADNKYAEYEKLLKKQDALSKKLNQKIGKLFDNLTANVSLKELAFLDKNFSKYCSSKTIDFAKPIQRFTKARKAFKKTVHQVH